MLRRLALGLALMLALSGMDGATPATAQPAATQGRPGLSAAELQARRARIRSFFHARLQRLNIVATTGTPSGQTIDWIDPKSQTADGTLAPAPEPSVAPPTPGLTGPPEFSLPGPTAVARLAQTEVQWHPSSRGPDGTVPVVRFDVEQYLARVTVPPDDPRDVLRKMPPPAPNANKRYYVALDRFGTFYGTSGVINLWDPVGPVNNETSIAQVAVSRGTPVQSVEAGKIELQSLNGDLQPHFFTYYTTTGYVQHGDWVGGYNTLVDGWIQVSPTVAPGMVLPASVDGGNR
ncbi:MAG TPA: neprosin family prolyl endopeptidase [Candidatus Tectomicrobia bacterium]